MKISAIEVFRVPYRLTENNYAWSGGHSVTQFTSTVVKVVTDAGLTGFGEVCPLGTRKALVAVRSPRGAISRLRDNGRCVRVSRWKRRTVLLFGDRQNVTCRPRPRSSAS